MRCGLAGALGLALLLAAAVTAWAATPLGDTALSPDTTVSHGGTVADDEDVLGTTASSAVLLDLGTLPEGVDVTAYHYLANGDQLFSIDIPATLSGTLFLPGDAIRYDGLTHTLEFDAAANGVDAGISLDAIAEVGGDLLLSFDQTVSIEGTSARAEDVLQFTPGGPPTVILLFDGSAQGVPAGQNVDAVHELPSGNLLLSFDSSGNLGGVDFDDEDVLEFSAGPTWELSVDLDAAQLDWAAADLYALWVIAEADDNCPSDWNPDQTDIEPDGLGDVCDPAVGDSDADDDGLLDGEEVFTYGTNPADDDSDDDGLLDGAEVTLGTDPNQPDHDGDGVCDGSGTGGGACSAGPDNCPFVINLNQNNSDAFSAGDACQCGDLNLDNVLDGADKLLARQHVVGATIVGTCDLTRCNVIGPMDGDVSSDCNEAESSDCTVADVFVLDRVAQGLPVSLQNVCNAYLAP